MTAPVIDLPTARTASEPVDAPATETPPEPGAALAIRPRYTLNAKLAYARHLSESGLVPRAYQGRPANVLYALEFGEMLNIHPIAAMIGVHIIDGKPTASAALMSMLVRSAGHRLRVSFDAETMTATAEIVRHDDPEFTFRSVWTLDRAVTALLCEIRNGKPWARSEKGKPTSWEKYPPAMLKARAISEVARDAAEEALMGAHYTPEELGADVDEDGNVVDGEVVDTAPEPPDTTDWDAEIAKIVDDDKALGELWRTAPRDSEARTKIAAAGTAAAARRKAAAANTSPDAPAAEPAPAPGVADADGIVEAEIVDPPAAAAPAAIEQSNGRLGYECIALFDVLVETTNPDVIRAQVTATSAAALRRDAGAWLTDDDLEVLGIAQDVNNKIMMRDLAAAVLSYVERHQVNWRQPVDADPFADLGEQ